MPPKGKSTSSHSSRSSPSHHSFGGPPPQSSYSQQHESIYVSALGRDVPRSIKYESCYDSRTECCFFLNTEMDPPVWLYWFEGISSDYGDYGWLEWDACEAR